MTKKGHEDNNTVTRKDTIFELINKLKGKKLLKIQSA